MATKAAGMLGSLLRLRSEPLAVNSFYIFGASVAAAAVSFLFWMVAARSYPVEALGIGSALLAAVSLLTLLSKLGFDIAMMRFFPLRDRSVVFTTSLLVTCGLAIPLGLAFLVGLPAFAPDLAGLSWEGKAFFLVALLISLAGAQGASALVAARRGDRYFQQNALLVTKLPFLLLLLPLGSLGILGAATLSLVVAGVATAYFLAKEGIGLVGTVDRGFLSDAWSFSAKNYAVELARSAPALILPLMVLAVEGPAASAIYYVAYTMGAILFLLPQATSMSLLVEGSHGSSLGPAARRAATLTALLLAPGMLVLYFGAEAILGLLATEYVQGASVLRGFVLSAPLVGLVYVLTSIMRVRGDVSALMTTSALMAVGLVAGSYWAVPRWGLVGIPVAWLVVHAASALALVFAIRMRPSPAGEGGR